MGMNINLTAQQEETVREKVNSGLYTSASEVIQEALRLMDERDQMLSAKLQQLRQDLQEGLDSGPSVPWSAEEMKQSARKSRRPKAGEA